MLMTRKTDFWQPQYVINSNIIRLLMEIEAARVAVEYTPLTPAVENIIRNRVRIRSSHYSTFIEGNRLTIQEANAVVNLLRDKPGGFFP